jgi:hypothetical protein
VAEKQTFDRDELHDVSRRAFALAKQTGDPSLRAALNLFGEAAENLAAKLPADSSEAAASQAPAA